MLQGIIFLHSQNVIHRDIKGTFRKLGNEYLCLFGLENKLNVNIDHVSSFIMEKTRFFFLSIHEVSKSEFSEGW